MTAPLCKDCVHYCAGWRYAVRIFGGAHRVPDAQTSTCKRADHVDGSGKSGCMCQVERFTPAVIGGCDVGGQYFVPAAPVTP